MIRTACTRSWVQPAISRLFSTSSTLKVMFPTGDEASSKSAWRKTIKEITSQLPEEGVLEQSRVAAASLQALPVYQQARGISIFLSMPGAELQTAQIVTHALESGKTVFVPFITRKSPTMDMLQLRDQQDFNALKPDNWGIPSLDPASVEDRTNCLGYKGVKGTPAAGGHLDLVLVPAVAFDQDYNRLGHGKGYYDRFLKHYAQSTGKQPYLIGLALNEQIVHAPHKLPAEPWDVKIDAILVGGDFRYRIPPPV